MTKDELKGKILKILDKSDVNMDAELVENIKHEIIKIDEKSKEQAI